MKILAIQNRMGIGDTVIFCLIKALYKKFNSPISLLVKESSKADQYLYQTNYIDNLIILERDGKNSSRHSGFLGSINLIKDLKKYSFDKIFIFNSSLRFNLIARFSKIPGIYQYPLFSKTDQHITNTPKKFLKDKLNIEINEDPEIQIDDKLVHKTNQKFNLNKSDLNILLGIGDRVNQKESAQTFLEVIKKISKIKCKFFSCYWKIKENK